MHLMDLPAFLSFALSSSTFLFIKSLFCCSRCAEREHLRLITYYFLFIDKHDKHGLFLVLLRSTPTHSDCVRLLLSLHVSAMNRCFFLA